MEHEHDISDIADLRPGDHLCCLYETEEEHRALVTPYIRQGLERNEKVFYIVDAHTSEEILAYLRSDDLDVEAYLASGQLSILTRDDSYMREGTFDPDGMISLLRSETDVATEQGYTCLRVTGEMTWALRGLPGSERLIEYEAKLNRFFPGSRAMAICQYDRRRFSPKLLLEVLTTHPIAVVGTRIYPNFYFMPTEEFLQEDRSAATLAHWLKNLEDRQKAAEALIENEELFRGLVEQSTNGIALVDHQGRILEWNRSMEEITGLKRQETLERYLWDIQFGMVVEERRAPEVYRQLKEALLSALKTGGAPWMNRALEQEISRPDGSRGYVQMVTFPIRTSRDIVLASISSDITARKTTEEALRRSSYELGERVKELNCLYEIAGLIERPGISLDEILQGAVDITHQAMQYPETTCVRVTLEGQDFTSSEFMETEWISTNDINIEGRKVGAIEVFRKEGREEEEGELFLAEEQSLLSAIAERLGHVAERTQHELKMEQLNADLQAFGHTLSHDLKAPLSNATGYALTLERMLEGRLNDREADNLEVTIHSLKSMDRIIDGMLQYASLEKEEGSSGEVGLDEVLEGILEELRGSGSLGENCRLEVAPLPAITGDPARLRQVFYNLISNAAKFTADKEEPVIEVGIEETPRGRAVYVRDNGPGIRPEDQERIFELLTRTDEAATVPGYGLGLAIVKRAVQSWNGRVWVESKPGEGATFYFTLQPS